jgi:signal transduction histidine kinase
MASVPHRRGLTRPRPDAGSDAGVPVGHVYIDVRRRLLYCLDETARRLRGEGVPFTSIDRTRAAVTTLAGGPVADTELPLLRAWREDRPAEAVFALCGKGAPTRHLHWTAAPLRDATGQLLAVLGTVILRPPEPDWQMLAGLAHDLRNPLQALRLSLDDLPREDQLPEELRETVARVRRATERALSVGKDLLDWARGPAQGGRRVEAAWFALEPFLAGLADEQAVAARRKGLSLVQDLAAAERHEIQSDRVRLSRLLTNLLANAIRYTSTGHVEFVTSWLQDPAGRQLCLAVQDTGAGILPEEQESIFQAFERGSAGRSDSSGGSGLGLTVVDRLVQELRLTLEMSSDVGRGTSFRLIIPATMLRAASP